MFYEIEITLRTLRKEGLGSLLNKIRVYVTQLAQGLVFLCRRKPAGASVEELVNFGWTAAGGLIQPAQVRSELVQLANLIKERKPKTILEIGTAGGGTLFLWCRLADPKAHIISIDLPGGIHGGGYPFWKSFIYKTFAQPGQKLSLIRANSQSPETLAALKKTLGTNSVDFMFIDGDHTYKGIKADFENYSPLASKEGVVVLHDICIHPAIANCQVDVFWNEIKSRHRNQEFIENPAQGTCGIGVLHL